MKRTLALCLGLTTCLHVPAGAQRLAGRDTMLVDSLASAAMRAGSVMGMTVSVARGSEAPWVKGYGFADRERGTRATATTVYRIRSISKTFAAAAVLQLATRGKVALDSSIVAYVPDAPTRGARVTVRQLLSHTSGLPDYHGAVWRAHYHERLPVAEWVHLMDAESLAFAPGSDYAYSNLGFDLLALLVERVSGERYADYLRRHLTAPLGLRATTVCTEEAPPAARATPYDVRSGALVPADAWGDVELGAGMLCSTAGDLVAWARALDAGRVLDRRWLTTMRTPAMLSDGTRLGYAMGTRLGELDGHHFVGHTGSGGGWSAALADYEADRLSIVVLTNTEAEMVPAALAAQIARGLLQLPGEVARTAPPDVVAADTGRWVKGSDTALVVATESGMTFRPLGGAGGPPPAPLEYLGGNRFRIAPVPSVELQFVASRGGATSRSDRMLVRQSGFLESVAHRAP